MLSKRRAKAARKTLVRVYDLPKDASYVRVAKELVDNGLLVELKGERRAPINKEEAGALMVAISWKMFEFPNIHL